MLSHGYVTTTKHKLRHLNYVDSIEKIIEIVRKEYESKYEIIFDFSSNKNADNLIVSKFSSKDINIKPATEQEYNGLIIVDLLKIKLDV